MSSDDNNDVTKNNIQSFLDGLAPMLSVVDEVLNKWNGEGCLQFPTLLGQVALQLNWDDKQSRENDPIIRKYVRNHSEWHVTRGAHGGIMRASEKQKKDAAIEAKKKAKEEVKAALEAKLAEKQQQAAANASQQVSEEDNTNIVAE